MAIQLNDRDHLIFKLINEHHVLLEKHISWFISGEEKPVLIRDRLRKLFYLDYLLCQRHNTKLPWWTTPTKPLVYMLSPMSKSLFPIDENGVDLLDNDTQRHLLEIANIRMMWLVAQRAGEIADLNWTTGDAHAAGAGLDATISFRSATVTHNIGVINHPSSQSTLLGILEQAFVRENMECVVIISRDHAHQESIYKQCTQSPNGLPLEKILLTTHQDLYKSGIAKASWLDARHLPTLLIEQPLIRVTQEGPWSDSFAASA